MASRGDRRARLLLPAADPLPSAPAGTVIRSQAAAGGPTLPAGARAYRVLYHSTSASGGDLAESGVVVVPGGTPPAGGFPIVSWAHGTTGVASGCAPSVTGTSTLPYLAALLRNGDIVAATDYRGLGAPGQHPYLVGTSEAEDVLDAARAARSLVGRAASDQVAVLGFSQGGQAALFAGELAPRLRPRTQPGGRGRRGAGDLGARAGPDAATRRPRRGSRPSPPWSSSPGPSTTGPSGSAAC